MTLQGFNDVNIMNTTLSGEAFLESVPSARYANLTMGNL